MPSPPPTAASPSAPASPPSADSPADCDFSLATVRASCLAAVSATDCAVRIDDAAIERLASALVASPPPALLRPPPPPALPLRWSPSPAVPPSAACPSPPPAEAVSTALTLALLNCGSGWRRELHAAAGGGAGETVTRAVVAAHICGLSWGSAAGARAATAGGVAEAAGVETSVERELAPAIRISEPGPLAGWARCLAGALNAAGAALAAAGAVDWSA